MTIFLFLDKNTVVKDSDGLWSLEKLSYEDKAASSNLAFGKDKSLLQKFSCFTSWNNNSKGSENSEYSTDLGFTEKLSPVNNTLYHRHLIHIKIYHLIRILVVINDLNVFNFRF